MGFGWKIPNPIYPNRLSPQGNHLEEEVSQLKCMAEALDCSVHETCVPQMLLMPIEVGSFHSVQIELGCSLIQLYI